MQLRLTHKGLLLVAIPLIFELVFVASLTWLLNRAEDTAARASYYKDVTTETNSVITELYEAASSLVSYHVARNDVALRRHYEELLINISRRFGTLVKLVGDDPVQQQFLRKIEPELEATLTFIKGLKAAIDRHDDLAAVYSITAWSDNIRGPFKRLMLHLKELVDYQTDRMRALPEQEERTRLLIKQCLAVGVGLNVLIAVWIALLVTRGMTRRVEALMENSARLAGGKALKPPQQGNDEIARLDVVFHEMAKALNDAAEKERAITDSIKASEARIRSIIESMLVGLVIFDDLGTIESLNPRTEQLFKCSQSDLLGKSAGMLFEKSSKSESFLDDLKANALGHVVELKAERSNGEIFPAEVTLSELQSASEHRYLLNILDVSERHEVERMKREFVAMVSHDLRTPLTSVLSSLSLLSAGALGELNDKGYQIVADSEIELSRLIHLINDLLDIARMEAGKMEFRFAPIKISAVVDASINAVRGVAQQKSIALEALQSEAQLYADKDRLVQVLVNLLSNAIKFSPEQSQVSILVEELKDEVMVSVKDSGRGIPDSHKETIFERFQQVKSSDASDFGGSGLGLAICKTIIDGHGGTIGVDSEAGAGSIFWFKLPLAAGRPSPS